jgi:CRP/FNR family transcriptional regulator, cyclic AMP receptor protein
MTMSSVARSPWGPPNTVGNDAQVELEARKRRIMRRGALGNAACPASHTALVEAGTVQRIERGRMVMGQGDAATSVVLIGMGRVRLTRALGESRSLAIGYRGAGDLVGEAALGGVPTHRENAVATEDVEALFVPAQTVRAVMAADPPFGAALLTMLVERHGDTEERLASVLFRNVEGRLCEFLLKAAARWGIPEPRGVLIAATFTHQEMANMIGSTRETVTLTLGDLRRQGIVEIDRRRIVILDRDMLRSRL